MIRRLKKEMFRRQLRKTSFYDGVTFESEEIEKVVSEWIFDLKYYRQIELSKFTELFCNWEEIVLPVIIKKKVITKELMSVIIIDAEEKKYYMRIHRILYFDLEEYDIGRRGNIVDRNIDREFCYKICQKDKIVLEASYAGLLNEDGTNQDCMAAIHYNIKQNTAIASIKNKRKKLVISYNAKDNHVDNDVINYLLSIRESDCYKDVLSVFKDFVAILGNNEDIISIEAREKERIHSRICIDQGEITDYLYCEEGEDGQLLMHRIDSPVSLQI